jgi:hypothetical protein
VSTDWQDEVLRDAVYQDIQFSASGGSAKINTDYHLGIKTTGLSKK